MTLVHIAFLFFGTALVSFAATALTLHFLESRGIVDTPNERSSHAAPTPRGGGLAVIVVILVAWGLALDSAFTNYLWLFAATLSIALVSWIDDLGGLSALVRLLSQFAAVGIVFWLMPTSNLYFHGLLPFWLDNVIAFILWVWFINLFNFMDGIDGITAVESIGIGLGVFFLMIIGSAQMVHGLLGLSISAAALGFLWWNWQPAKIFLGDVGSVPLGFLLGWLLLEIMASPVWPAALILPLYYLADATITLIRRALRGEKIWSAHREHYYQQAVQRGLNHAKVASIIGLANILLIGLTILSINQPLTGIGGAIIIVAGLLFFMRGSSETS